MKVNKFFMINGLSLRRGFLALLLIMASFPLFAQTAAKLETLLANPAVSWQDATLFVLEAAGLEYAPAEPAAAVAPAAPAAPAAGAKPAAPATPAAPAAKPATPAAPAAPAKPAEAKTPTNAFKYAADKKWLPKDAAAWKPATFDGIALLLMSSFDLKGGLFYGITKSPHHAYRELVYKNIIRGETDPHMNVSGRELLLIISRILSITEKQAGVVK